MRHGHARRVPTEVVGEAAHANASHGGEANMKSAVGRDMSIAPGVSRG